MRVCVSVPACDWLMGQGGWAGGASESIFLPQTRTERQRDTDLLTALSFFPSSSSFSSSSSSPSPSSSSSSSCLDTHVEVTQGQTVTHLTTWWGCYPSYGPAGERPLLLLPPPAPRKRPPGRLVLQNHPGSSLSRRSPRGERVAAHPPG